MNLHFGGNTLATAHGPQDLIPGNTDALNQAIEGLTLLGQSTESAGTGMAHLCTGQGWTGRAAEAFRAAWRIEPERWSTLGKALVNPACALEEYRNALHAGQEQALLAMKEWRAAKATSDAAAAEHKRLSDEYNHATRFGQQVPAPPPFNDPGAAGQAAAQERLDSARSAVGLAATRAAAALIDADTALPDTPGAWQRFTDGFSDTFATIGTQLSDVAGGAVDTTIGAIGTVQRLNGNSPYNATHPQQYQQRLGAAAGLITSAVQHPAATIHSALTNVAHELTHDPGRALGSLLPGAVLGTVTGGTGEAAVAGEDLLDGAAADLPLTDSALPEVVESPPVTPPPAPAPHNPVLTWHGPDFGPDPKAAAHAAPAPPPPAPPQVDPARSYIEARLSGDTPVSIGGFELSPPAQGPPVPRPASAPALSQPEHPR